MPVPPPSATRIICPHNITYQAAAGGRRAAGFRPDLCRLGVKGRLRQSRALASASPPEANIEARDRHVS